MMPFPFDLDVQLTELVAGDPAATRGLFLDRVMEELRAEKAQAVSREGERIAFQGPRSAVHPRSRWNPTAGIRSGEILVTCENERVRVRYRIVLARSPLLYLSAFGLLSLLSRRSLDVSDWLWTLGTAVLIYSIGLLLILAVFHLSLGETLRQAAYSSEKGKAPAMEVSP